MRGFLKIVTSKVFLKHLGIIIVLTAIIYIAIFKFLDIITLHDKYIVLPDYSNMTLEQIDSLPSSENLEFVVIDSIYDKSRVSGSVFMQDPLPYSKAKKGRKVYVTIVATTPEMVVMPDLLDLSVRQAVTLLETYGLQVGRLFPEKSRFINAVLAQLYMGDTIHADTMVVKGAAIDLVIGSGNRKIPIPFLIGLNEKEAKRKIYTSSLNLGSVHYFKEDSAVRLRVYKQKPSYEKETYLPFGEKVSIWLRSEKNFDFEALIKSFEPDTTALDSVMVDEIMEEF